MPLSYHYDSSQFYKGRKSGANITHLILLTSDSLLPPVWRDNSTFKIYCGQKVKIHLSKRKEYLKIINLECKMQISLTKRTQFRNIQLGKELRSFIFINDNAENIAIDKIQAILQIFH